MARFSAIVLICILTVSGCAVFDSPEMSREPQAATVPAVMETPAEREPAEIEVALPAPVLPARRNSIDDVRRMQRHLRNVGFDPGPIDGIAGTKTKIAFRRLTDGCDELKKRPQAFPPPAVMAKSPAREEVIRMQTDLRDAGFQPGPIDGIYGPRTKGLIAQIPAACEVAEEFARSLDGFTDAGGTTPSAPRSALETGAAAQPAANRSEVGARNAAAHHGEAREDVRILQLRLRDAGFDPGPFDGVMGAKTRAALAQYEASQRNSKVKTSLRTTKISGQY